MSIKDRFGDNLSQPEIDYIRHFLQDCDVLCIDVETYDPDLKKLNAGYLIGKGNIICLAIIGMKANAHSNINNYIETYMKDIGRMQEQGRAGMHISEQIQMPTGVMGFCIMGEPQSTNGWYNKGVGFTEQEMEIIAEISEQDAIKIGHNLKYDLGWLDTIRPKPLKGTLRDTSIIEALLDEWRIKYSLDALMSDYIGMDKASLHDEEFKMIDYLHSIGCKKVEDVRTLLYMVPPNLLAMYSLSDVIFTLIVYLKQMGRIVEQNKQHIKDVIVLESKLLYPLLSMSMTGVRLHTQKRRNYLSLMLSEHEKLETKLKRNYGIDKVNSAIQVAGALKNVEGIVGGKTPTGKPSITSSFLVGLTSRSTIAQEVHKLRVLDKLIKTFMVGVFSKYAVLHDGEEFKRIHCNFNQVRDGEKGTKTGRFSSSKPNMQQIPKREIVTIADEIEGAYSKFCRKICVPEEDHLWMRLDYSQIEYRVLAHYAVGKGSTEVRDAFRENPDTDYHKIIMDMTGLERTLAKNLNFGIMYGMGKRKAVRTYNWDEDYADNLFTIYNRKAPFISHTSNRITNQAKKRIREDGVCNILTIGGRELHIHEMAKAYVALNRLIQGSAADFMKKAIVDLEEAGIFDYLIPHLTIHDELDISVPLGSKYKSIVRDAKEIMENAYELKVPVKVEGAIGQDWGSCEDEQAEQAFSRMIA